MLLDMLNEKHSAYEARLGLWDYYYNSFVGGEEYRQGGYLNRYNNEGDNHYQRRIANTPYDNHVKTTVEIYRSFLFRDAPVRELGSLATNPFVQSWLHDVDLDGQGMDSFMKTANDWAMVYGNVWIGVDKPQYKASTMAEEMVAGIRAYATMYTPQNVTNWKYTKAANGRMELTYISVLEDCGCDDVDTFKIWTPEYCLRVRAEKSPVGEYTKIVEQEEYYNALGYVPFFNLLAQRSPIRGVGESLIAVVADHCRAIYNFNSELEQNIRISSHPTLVTGPNTDVSAGAGAHIKVKEAKDEAYEPHLLQPSGASAESILEAKRANVDAINDATHLSVVRTKRSGVASGDAIVKEREMLNSVLGDLADNLNEAEVKMWNIWMDWQALSRTPEFEVTYSKSFDTRDDHLQMKKLENVLRLVPNEDVHKIVQKEIVRLAFDDEEDLAALLASIDAQEAALVNPEAAEETDSDE